MIVRRQTAPNHEFRGPSISFGGTQDRGTEEIVLLLRFDCVENLSKEPLNKAPSQTARVVGQKTRSASVTAADATISRSVALRALVSISRNVKSVGFESRGITHSTPANLGPSQDAPAVEQDGAGIGTRSVQDPFNQHSGEGSNRRTPPPVDDALTTQQLTSARQTTELAKS